MTRRSPEFSRFNTVLLLWGGAVLFLCCCGVPAWDRGAHAASASVSAQEAPTSTDSDEESRECLSKITLGSAPIEIRHTLPEQSIPLPDFSQPGTIVLPERMELRVTAALLWHEQVVPVGRYQLSLVITEYLDAILEMVSGTDKVRVPLERADFGSPERGLRAELSSRTRGDNEWGSLWIRWHSIAFLGKFQRIASDRQQLGKWDLQYYHFPDDMAWDAALPIGTLKRSAGVAMERHLSLQRNGTEIRLQVVDLRYLEARSEQGALQFQRRQLRRTLRRAKDLSEEERGKLERQGQNMDTRLDQLAEVVRLLEDSHARYDASAETIPADFPPLSSGGVLQLIEYDDKLWLRTAGVLGTQRFLLVEKPQN